MMHVKISTRTLNSQPTVIPYCDAGEDHDDELVRHHAHNRRRLDRKDSYLNFKISTEAKLMIVILKFYVARRAICPAMETQTGDSDD
jgi:hypothetical protein